MNKLDRAYNLLMASPVTVNKKLREIGVGKIKAVVVAAAVAAGWGAGPAQALVFDFSFLASSSAQANAAFVQAGNIWSSVLTDDVTVKLEVGTATLSSGVLAQAGSVQGLTSYDNFRVGLTGDVTSTYDLQAVSSLQAGSSFGMLINRTSDNPNGSGSADYYRDNDGDANNQTIRMTWANAKAMGFDTSSYTGIDGSITFSDQYSWDYDASNGISSDSFDFVGIALHEIGHALGFSSGVDILDTNSPPYNGPFSDSQFTYVSPLDMFRYSAASADSGVIDWTADDREKFFSLDGGLNALAGFATGTHFGDGRQASHWKDNLSIGIMDPTAGYGEFLQIGFLDLLALDVIGWDVNLSQDVPEPSTYALLAVGLLGLGAARRRKFS